MVSLPPRPSEHSGQCSATTGGAARRPGGPALLRRGAVAMDEAPARQLAGWLTGEAGVPVHYRASPQRLHAL